jgi:hypothetical protein
MKVCSRCLERYAAQSTCTTSHAPPDEDSDTRACPLCLGILQPEFISRQDSHSDTTVVSARSLDQSQPGQWTYCSELSAHTFAEAVRRSGHDVNEVNVTVQVRGSLLPATQPRVLRWCHSSFAAQPAVLLIRLLFLATSLGWHSPWTDLNFSRE